MPEACGGASLFFTLFVTLVSANSRWKTMDVQFYGYFAELKETKDLLIYREHNAT